METILVSGPNDPKPVRRDVLVTKRVSKNVNSPTTFTVNDIYKLVDPGTTAFFTDIRFITASIYGDDTSTSVTVSGFADGASFVDHGTQGARRPVIHARFPETSRIQWHPVSDTTSVLTVAASSGTLQCQFTVEVRGDTGGST